MNEPWTIRRANAADADAISRLICRLTAHLIAPDCTATGTLRLLDAMSPERELQRLRGDDVYCIAEHTGGLQGVAAIRPTAHLYRLFVTEPMQKKGLARALWNNARQEFFRLHGASAITVNSARNAIHAYERFGFVAQGPEQVLNGVPTTLMLWQPEEGHDKSR